MLFTQQIKKLNKKGMNSFRFLCKKIFMPPYLNELIDFFNNKARFVLLVFQKYVQNFFYLQLETYTKNQTKFATIDDLYKDIHKKLTKDPYLTELVTNLLNLDHQEVHQIKAIFAKYKVTGKALTSVLVKSIIRSTHPKRVERTLGALIYILEQVDNGLISELNLQFDKQQELVNSSLVNNFFNYSVNLDPQKLITNLPFVYANQRIYRTVQALDNQTFSYLQQQNAQVEYFTTPNTKPLLRLLYFSLDSTHNMVERFTEAKFNFERMNANVEFTALHQSHGIGRNNKAWNTSMISDVAVSYSIAQDQIESSLLNKLPLVFGQCIHKVTKQLLPQNANLTIKWPNDLYLDNKKLSGLLISKVDSYYIISFGLNLLAKQQNIVSSIGQPVASIFSAEESKLKTNSELTEYSLNLSELVYNLLSAKSLTSSFDLAYYLKNSWLQPNDKVALTANDNTVDPQQFDATYLGLDEQGFIKLELADKTTKILTVPSYSIRKIN